ncbi:MAG: DUF1080 domain-containing protein [Planctomycetes bacterium]|nr:DUF1080 domain-containing protein [Planctomycetota bacterium]
MNRLTSWANLIVIVVSLVFASADSVNGAARGQRALNVPPKGFKALFNGRDLTGWKGLVENPKSRAKMSKAELAGKQARADEDMRAHWEVADGALVFDGRGHSLCTAKDYGDFEMFVDWKIEKGGDSGIYLRGTPQVQIWDTARTGSGAQVGSGGLYNNKKGPSKPLTKADKPVGQWNTFRIIMMGEAVTVFLNDVLVVDRVVMENYWERDKPIYPKGQIELQSHGSKLYFRNVFIRQIPQIPRAKEANKLTEQEKADGFKLLFNGRDLAGWQGNTKGYVAKDGMIVVEPKLGGGDLYTTQEYGNFIMRFEFKLTPGANNGLGIRTPMNVNAAYQGMELQILDNTAEKYKNLRDYQYHGSIYSVVAAKRGYLKPVGEWPQGQWNYQEVIANGKQITVKLNGTTIVDADISKVTDPKVIERHPGLNRDKGYIAFCGHGDKLAFRNLRIKVLD